MNVLCIFVCVYGYTVGVIWVHSVCDMGIQYSMCERDGRERRERERKGERERERERG